MADPPTYRKAKFENWIDFFQEDIKGRKQFNSVALYL